MSDTAPARPLDGAEFDPGSVIAALGPSIAGLSCDSRTLAEGDAFIAYPGVSADGRKHIPQALAAGAAGVIWEASGFHWSQEWETPNIPVEDLRRRAGLIADCFYGKPSASMTTAAVTGTNGKTTTAYLAAQMLNMLGQNAVFVGTIGVGAPEALEPANITTPDAVSLQALLAHHRSRGAHAAVIEASSHGLAQDRLSGYRCDIAAFTNLGKDHICDHGSAEAYAAAKASLFDIPGVRVAVINIDDEFGQLLKKRLSGQLELLSYGTGDDADIRVTESTGGNVSVRVGGEEHFWQMPGPGIHNALNTAAAAAIAHCAGHGWGEISRLIQESRLRMPPGRLEKVSEQPAVYVDYAHTAEALACALKTIRAAHPDARLTCVFGCGGDRDRDKRGPMGETAAQLADTVIVTSDNPRSENPEAIIAEVVAGAGTTAEVVVDRGEAIQLAISRAEAKDAVLVAGKGHERFQEFDGVKSLFDDAETARSALKGKPQ